MISWWDPVLRCELRVLLSPGLLLRPRAIFGVDGEAGGVEAGRRATVGVGMGMLVEM